MTGTLATEHDLFVFDLDGVVYIGPEPVPGAVAAITRLHEEGRAVAYATNNAARRASAVSAHLAELGVPASDGEEYFATALLMAAGRWGNGQGLYDYNAQAQALLTAMLHKALVDGKDGVRPIFSPTHGQVVFVPVGNAADFSDPSYHLPAFYEIWARRADKPEDRRRWREIADIIWGLRPDVASAKMRPLVGPGSFLSFTMIVRPSWQTSTLDGSTASAPAPMGPPPFMPEAIRPITCLSIIIEKKVVWSADWSSCVSSMSAGWALRPLAARSTMVRPARMPTL